MFYLILLLAMLVAIGVLATFFPEILWKYTSRLESLNPEGPSDWYIKMTRFSGVLSFIAAAGFLVVWIVAD